MQFLVLQPRKRSFCRDDQQIARHQVEFLAEARKPLAEMGLIFILDECFPVVEPRMRKDPVDSPRNASKCLGCVLGDAHPGRKPFGGAQVRRRPVQRVQHVIRRGALSWIWMGRTQINPLVRGLHDGKCLCRASLVHGHGVLVELGCEETQHFVLPYEPVVRNIAGAAHKRPCTDGRRRLGET